MNSGDLNIIEMLGCIYEDLDIEKIDEKFVDLVNDAFSFDRVALFFVKHKKGVLKGKLSHGFDQDVVKSIEIPLSGKSLLIDPLITGMAYRGISNIPDQYADLLGLTNFALIPIVNKKENGLLEDKELRQQRLSGIREEMDTLLARIRNEMQ